MPIEMGIWRIGDQFKRIDYSSMDVENWLEQILADDISIIDPNSLLIRRQVTMVG